MLKTIDAKIERLKHEGIVNFPTGNLIRNLPMIEEIVFETQSFEYDTDELCVN